MGETSSKLACPPGQKLFRESSGEPYCDTYRSRGPDIYVGFKCGLGNGYKPIQDADYNLIYCAPCQTIRYTCPDTRDVLESRRICPYDRTLQPRESIPPQEDVYVAAQSAILDLRERGCEIKTAGYFRATLRDWRNIPKQTLQVEASVACDGIESGKSAGRTIKISVPLFEEESEAGEVARIKAEVLGKIQEQETECEEPVVARLIVDGAVILSDSIKKEEAKTDCRSGAAFFSYFFSNSRGQAEKCAQTLTYKGNPHRAVEHVQKTGDDLKPGLQVTYYIVEPTSRLKE